MGKSRITKASARRFKERWAAMNEAEKAELRSASPSLKLRQLASLMASAKALSGRRKSASGAALVRRRWMRLRRVLGG
jgi:hypothetical protein